MSIFTAIGMKEPQWATNFKNNIINPDPIPNPLVKKDQAVIQKGGTDVMAKIGDFFKGITDEIGKLFSGLSTIVVIGIVIFVIYMFGKK